MTSSILVVRYGIRVLNESFIRHAFVVTLDAIVVMAASLTVVLLSNVSGGASDFRSDFLLPKGMASKS